MGSGIGTVSTDCMAWNRRFTAPPPNEPLPCWIPVCWHRWILVAQLCAHLLQQWNTCGTAGLLAVPCVHGLDAVRGSVEPAGPRRAHGRGSWVRRCTPARGCWAPGIQQRRREPQRAAHAVVLHVLLTSPLMRWRRLIVGSNGAALLVGQPSPPPGLLRVLPMACVTCPPLLPIGRPSAGETNSSFLFAFLCQCDLSYWSCRVLSLSSVGEYVCVA
jgi:hypothetical protein